MKDKKKYYRNKGNKKFRQRYLSNLNQDPELEIRGKKIYFTEIETDEYWNPISCENSIEAKDVLEGNYLFLDEYNESFDEDLYEDYSYDYAFTNEGSFNLHLSVFENNLLKNLQAALIKAPIKNDNKQLSLENRLLLHYEIIKGNVVSDINFHKLFTINHTFEIDKKELISVNRNYRGFIKLLLFSPFWISSPATWNKKDAISLGEHTFGKYELPKVFNRIWEDKSHIPIEYYYWYILLAQGGSIKRFTKHLKRKLHKETIFQLFEITEEMPITNAFKYARVLSRGGSFRDYTLFANAFMTDRFEQSNSFEIRCLDWMLKYGQEFSDQEYLLILNWARHEQSELARSNLKTFSWKGRKPERTLDRAINYYQTIVNTANEDLEWPKHDFDWEYTYDEDLWSFTELTTSEELREEGIKLIHCVASYDSFCAEGMSAIISLRKGGESKLTIEIEPYLKKVKQARGYSNRLPNEEEKTVLTAWIKEKGLMLKY